MSGNHQTQPQLVLAGAIQNQLHRDSGGWFDYLARVSPHNTDYGGGAWHGTYLTWMEEARIECLRSIGIEYADLVLQGIELPVVDLSIRYHRAVQMGQSIIVRTRMSPSQGVRINWDYQILSSNTRELHATAQVTLVGVDREKGKIIRQLPPLLKEALNRLVEGSGNEEPEARSG